MSLETSLAVIARSFETHRPAPLGSTSYVGHHYSVLRERPFRGSSALRQLCMEASSRDAGDSLTGGRPLVAPRQCLQAFRASWLYSPQRASLENSIASTSIFVFQATKSQRWMPWRLKPKKDVGGCDKPRGAADRASIRGCPNGETRHPSWGVTPV